MHAANLSDSAVQKELRKRLLYVYPSADRDFTSVLVNGSGTAAVEAMVSSLVPQNGHALVAANGAYGERMAALLLAQGKNVHMVRSGWTDPINFDAVHRILSTEPRISHVLAVHHETTTGRLNDIPRLGEMCAHYDVPLLLDCVSSFGAEEIDFENWNLEACAATSNQCLQAPTGMSFVVARRNVLDAGQSGATSVDFDLFRHYADQKMGSSSPAESTDLCHGLLRALQELQDSGGWRSRRQCYATISRKIFIALLAQGIKPALDITAPSAAEMTAYRIPKGYEHSSLHDCLKASGFAVHSGTDKFDREIFRISVMGMLNFSDIDKLIRALEEFWKNRKCFPAASNHLPSKPFLGRFQFTLYRSE